MVPQGVECGTPGSGVWYPREWSVVPQGVECGTSGSGVWYPREWSVVPQGVECGFSHISGSIETPVNKALDTVIMYHPLIRGKTRGSLSYHSTCHYINVMRNLTTDTCTNY